MENNKNLADAIGFGLTLIFFGVVFLLANWGFLNWEVIWIYISRFWPLWIIFAGLKMIVGKNVVVRVIIKVFELIVMLGLLILISFYSGVDKDKNKFWNYSKTELEEKIIIVEDDFENLEKRKIDFNLGASEFLVEDIKNDYHMRFDGTYYGNKGIPKIEEDYKGDELELEFTLDKESVEVNPFLWLNGNYEGVDYEFAIGNQELKTDLNLKVGASKGTVDLEELNINEFNVDLGAGKMDMVLGKDAIPEKELDIKVGAGKLTLKLPKDVGLNIDYNVGAGSLILGEELDASGIGETGVYKTENYDRVEKKLELKVNVGAGKVEIIRE